MTDQLLHLIAQQSWQIAGLTMIVAVMHRTFARNRPHLAHVLWMLVLIKSVTPPIWSHSFGIFSHLQAAWSVNQNVPENPGDVRLTAILRESVDPLQSTVVATNRSELSTTDLEDVTETRESPVPANRSVLIAATSQESARSNWNLSWPVMLLSLIGIGAVTVMISMAVRCCLCLWHLQKHRTVEFDDVLREQLTELAEKLHIRRVPKIMVSDVLFGPAVFGFWRHVIVLPKCLIESGRTSRQNKCQSDEDVASGCEVPLSRKDLQFLEPILAHELLHIRRGDLRTGLVQAISQSLWWFHPAVWICSRWLAREAERCCDEQVIAELGCSPTQYARCLLSVIESKHSLQPIPIFPGMKPVEITSQRMERIMSLKRDLKKQTPVWCWVTVILLAVVVLPGAAAQVQSEEPPINSEPVSKASAPAPIAVQQAPAAEAPQNLILKKYEVGNLVDRLAKERGLSQDEARSSLLQMLDSIALGGQGPTPEPLMPLRWADEKNCIGRLSAAAHTKLGEAIQRFGDHGFKTVEISAFCITGLEEDIARLITENFQSLSNDHELLKKNKLGSAIVSSDEIRKLPGRVELEARNFAVQPVKVQAFNGQEATVRLGELKPWIVGTKPNGDPEIRTTSDGLSVTLISTIQEDGSIRLQCAATLASATEVKQGLVAKNASEIPQAIQIPSIDERRVQTEVGLNDSEGLLQYGLIRTPDGKEKATIVIVETREAEIPLALEQGQVISPAPEIFRPLAVVYNVADLIAPNGAGQQRPDVAPLVELIKATIAPTTWEQKPGRIMSQPAMNSIVVVHGAEVHEEIRELLTQLRKDQDLVSIKARLVRLDSEEQLKEIEKQCSLHSLNDQKRWALLTKERSEAMSKYLAEQECQVISSPRLTTLSGSTGAVEVGNEDGEVFNGFRLVVEPRVIADSRVIRLKHAVEIGRKMTLDEFAGADGFASLVKDELLIASGQTLLLVIEPEVAPTDQNAGQATARFVVLLTVERLEEAESAATDPQPSSRSLNSEE